MRQAAGLIFDEVIGQTVGGDFKYYTSPKANGILAVSDQLGIQAVVDDVTNGGPTPPMLSIWLETSGNGVYWATKNVQPEVAPFTLATNATTVSSYSGDSGVLPSLRYARLRLTLSTSGPANAHVKVFVTLRDAGGEIVVPMSVLFPPSPPKPPSHENKEPKEKENTHIYSASSKKPPE